MALISRNDALKMANSCTWCGFCEAVCPTFRVSSEKVYGPRGRTWLTLLFLEGKLKDLGSDLAKSTYTCITCRACLRVCPSKIDVPLLMAYMRSVIAEGG